MVFRIPKCNRLEPNQTHLNFVLKLARRFLKTPSKKKTVLKYDVLFTSLTSSHLDSKENCKYIEVIGGFNSSKL